MAKQGGKLWRAILPPIDYAIVSINNHMDGKGDASNNLPGGPLQMLRGLCFVLLPAADTLHLCLRGTVHTRQGYLTFSRNAPNLLGTFSFDPSLPVFLSRNRRRSARALVIANWILARIPVSSLHLQDLVSLCHSSSGVSSQGEFVFLIGGPVVHESTISYFPLPASCGAMVERKPSA